MTVNTSLNKLQVKRNLKNYSLSRFIMKSWSRQSKKFCQFRVSGFWFSYLLGQRFPWARQCHSVLSCRLSLSKYKETTFWRTSSQPNFWTKWLFKTGPAIKRMEEIWRSVILRAAFCNITRQHVDYIHNVIFHYFVSCKLSKRRLPPENKIVK